jgi:hypothetical protein
MCRRIEVLTVAGRVVREPAPRLIAYAQASGGRTVRDYDLPGPGDPCALTLDEIIRTRKVNSRISNEQAAAFYA